MKYFLPSLLATTVSIALTFGTAAVIDRHKKQKEKLEIVMMVMYDMYHSLNSVEKADSMLFQSMKLQLQLAEDSTQFKDLRFQFGFLMPKIDFTETTERIFTSSIETIHTVGNVLFTENVTEFYQCRQLYKTTICDSIYNEAKDSSLSSFERILDFNYFDYVLLSKDLSRIMRSLFSQCKQMMEVTDEKLEDYRRKREQMDEDTSDTNAMADSLLMEVFQLQNKIDDAKKKIKIE